MAVAERAADGRFRPRYDLLTLRRIVVEIARTARPDDPRMLSSTAFDDLRAHSSWPDAPCASWISKRIGVHWRMVVSLALSNERDWAKTVGKVRQAKLIQRLSEEEIAQAIQFVAARTPERHIRPAHYDVVRERAVRADRRHWMYGGLLAEALPNSEQIRHAAGTWERALELAGRGPLPTATAHSRWIVEVLDAYVDATGRLAPVGWVVREWGRVRGESVERKRHRDAYYLGQLAARRAARGVETPPLDGPGCVHLPLPAASRERRIRRARLGCWEWSTCVARLADLLLRLPPGTRSVTQRRYRVLIADSPVAMPWPAALRRVVKREEQRRRDLGEHVTLRVDDLWAAAAERATNLRTGAVGLDADFGRVLSRPAAIIRFCDAYDRFPLKRELNQFASERGLLVEKPHSPHVLDVIAADDLLLADAPVVYARVHAALDAAHAADAAAAAAKRRAQRIRERPRRREAVPASDDGRGKPGAPRGVPREDAIDAFIEEQGAFPSEGLLRYWARSVRGMSLAQPKQGVLHADVVRRVSDTRKSAGRSLPTTTLTMRRRAQLRPSHAPPPEVATRVRRWPLEQSIAAAERLLAEVGGDGEMSGERWRRLTIGRADVPSYSCLRRRARDECGISFREFIDRIRTGMLGSSVPPTPRQPSLSAGDAAR